MSNTKKTLIFTVFISLLLIINILLYAVAIQLFPTYGGYNRQILFIKSNEDDGTNGYFIMLDDLSSQSQNFEIDWLLHSRGNLTVGTDGQSISYKVP
ncbi:MAG: hypothetical protein GF317_24905, partial [Candidatus Lokiarchaeota archaeon]|nr:hypothetical protein [Candidatus Lokiarchaeota archaeon]MBD3202599.1 hypothetical protein [Candidatus Lokiarchaeota archaeon]